jgi:polyisoprenoid-binding protein YceI
MSAAGFCCVAWTCFVIGSLGTPAGVRRFVPEDKVGKNQLIFSVDTGTEKVTGLSNSPTWNIQFDAEDLRGTLRCTIVVPVESLDAGKPEHNQKLRGPEWLNSEKYPEIRYELRAVKSVKAAGSAREWQVQTVGVLLARGKTNEVETTFRLVYAPESDATRKRAPGDLVALSGKFELPLHVFTAGELRDKTMILEMRLFGSTAAGRGKPSQPKAPRTEVEAPDRAEG